MKSLGVVKQEQIELTEKLKVADQARLSVKASLKTTERQAEDQRQKLHLTEIDLATQRQLVIDLKVELQKAKEEAQLAREAAEAEKKASYQLGVEETQVRLAKELSEICGITATRHGIRPLVLQESLQTLFCGNLGAYTITHISVKS